MKYLASVHIFHLPSNTHFYTVEEDTPSKDEAKVQFSKLAEVISSMEKDNHIIVLETTEGWIALTRKFLSDTVLQLKVAEIEESYYDNAG